ncbi:MAG: DUF1614 domain-containing protein [Candidatus Bathyarchaeota archaeon]|nr:DUF1614 domain-containing protein [Candidatus Bathyarchaeota archaeon]
MGYQGRAVFRPVSVVYLLLLFVSLLVAIPVIILLIGDLLVSALGIPAQWVGAFLFLSLFGSFVNIPVATIESSVPLTRVREVTAFGVTWQVPSMGFGVSHTRVMINLGGAILPIIVSGYLLGMPLIHAPGNPVDEYLAVAAVLAIVTVVVNRSSGVVRGLGFATPALVPPLVTTLATVLVDYLTPLHSPAQIAYIGGTLGTLIGADLLNLHRVSGVGAPVVSIGGAGTFDGVYLTGLVSVALVVLTLG